jgi:hypothetical protein
MPMNTTRQLLRATWERDRLVVPVAWKRAEALQTHLRAQGMHSTLCLEPLAREAHLEVHTKDGAEAVQAILDRWNG